MELPQQFISQLEDMLPAEEASSLVSALSNTDAQVSVRVNVSRGVTVPAQATRVAWCNEGFYLDSRVPFTFDPDFRAGCYYVQDASSMFISHVIRSLVASPVRYLDLCAAPGGKTTAAIDALPAGSLIVANEVNNARALALTDNVVKWGCENVVVASSAPKAVGKLTAYFDVIAADVPCSGEGMMRKEAEAVAQWSPRLVADCAALQRTIIDDVWVALKPGGLLIYSTCTFNREENERNVEYIVERYGAEPVEVPVPSEWNIADGIDTAVPCYRFMPHRTRGEGLFMCVLRKPEGNVTPVSPRAKKSAKPTALPAQVKGWVRNAEDMSFDVVPDKVTVVPARYADDVQLLQSALRTLLTGVEVAAAKGRDWAPTQWLAMWRGLASGVFPEVELTYADAMAYLRGESLRIDAPRGYVLVCRHGHRLGFVNNLGSRANNLYPKPWRTLKAQYPNDEPRVVE